MHTFSVFNPVYDISTLLINFVKHVASRGYSMKFIDYITNFVFYMKTLFVDGQFKLA